MYLCGYPIETILERKLPQRAKEHGLDLSFELSIVVMLELKSNTSTALVHGSLNHGAEMSHAWVEYRDACEKRWVIDYCADWKKMSFTAYSNKLFPDTERLYLHYIFWTDYTERLYYMMQKPETSYILEELVKLRPKFRNGKVFGILDFYGHTINENAGTTFDPVWIEGPDGNRVVVSQEFFEYLLL